MEINSSPKSLTEKIALKLANRMCNPFETDSLHFLKVKYGLEVLLINLSKMFFILTIAGVLGILKGALLVMLSFAFIRSYAFGVHAKSSINCTIITSLFFLIGAYIPKFFNITNSIVALLFCMIILLIYLYAPADTEARPLVEEKLRKKLKMKSLIFVGILMLIAFSINSSDLKFFISYGVLCESITITPFIYKLFGRKYKNYEHYKKAIN